MTTYTTDIGASVNGFHRYGNNLLASVNKLCSGDQVLFNHIYWRDVDELSWTNLYLSDGSTRPRFESYDKFVFMVDGEKKLAFNDGFVYDWGIPNPTDALIVEDSGVEGNPDGEYTCYCTFYIEFSNGKVYETGPSPSITLTVATNQLTWILPICPEVGSGTLLKRRLYRTVSGVPYLVTTISDNTTITYTDNVTDATLQGSSILSTTNYYPPPTYIVDVAVHLQRMFVIKENKLYYTEPYMPFAFLTNDDIVVSRDDETLTGLIVWSEQLYIPSRYRWYRLQGSSSDTWSIKQTFTDTGVINKNTLAVTRFGILGLYYDGIYLFDGATNKKITEKYLGTQFFENIDDLSKCWAFFDGLRYYFYYIESTPKCLVLDFSYYPDIRWYFEDVAFDARTFYAETGDHYLARCGYEFKLGDTEIIPTEFWTGDFAFKDITKRKLLKYIYYDVDTGGEDLVIEIYVDGTIKQTWTLNTSTRVRKREETVSWKCEGYRFNIRATCDDSSSLSIYAPWGLEADYVGN